MDYNLVNNNALYYKIFELPMKDNCFVLKEQTMVLPTSCCGCYFASCIPNDGPSCGDLPSAARKMCATNKMVWVKKRCFN